MDKNADELEHELRKLETWTRPRLAAGDRTSSKWKRRGESTDVLNLGTISCIARDDEWAIYGTESENGQRVITVDSGDVKSRQEAKEKAESAAKWALKQSLSMI